MFGEYWYGEPQKMQASDQKQTCFSAQGYPPCTLYPYDWDLTPTNSTYFKKHIHENTYSEGKGWMGKDTYSLTARGLLGATMHLLVTTYARSTVGTMYWDSDKPLLILFMIQVAVVFWPPN